MVPMPLQSQLSFCGIPLTQSIIHLEEEMDQDIIACYLQHFGNNYLLRKMTTRKVLQI
jgi:hypothetical protein